MRRRPYTDSAGWMWRAAGLIMLLAFAVMAMTATGRMVERASRANGLPPTAQTGTSP